MSQQYFHFTLGPVQGFVAQARRTRDFWAGSFILSWLSAVAMVAVKKQDGKILFPIPDENYLAWVEGKDAGEKPRQGSIPNRFKAEVNAGFDPKIVIDTVQEIWRQLGDYIWENDLKDICMEEQKEIWDDQIKGFWEIAWAITSDEAESDILDRRKNLRSHMPPSQEGVKCMVMEGWQELSGAERPGYEVENFWEKVRSKKINGFATDFRQ